MKPTLIVLSFLLFAFFTKISFTAVVAGDHAQIIYHEAVVDINGERVRTGVDYHIYRQPTENGDIYRGLTLPQRKCSLDVVLSEHQWDALPVTISQPGHDGSSTVFLNTDLSLKFSIHPNTVCNISTTWNVPKKSESGYYFVTIGGAPESTSFRIAKYKPDENDDHRYKFLYCSSALFCSCCRCVDIGLEHLLGVPYEYVVADKEPFPIVFSLANINHISTV